MITTRSSPWLAAGSLIGALGVHYLIYAFRFMWYLDHSSFSTLIAVYVVFVVLECIEYIWIPRWWIMAPTAFVVMVAPAFSGINYHVPLGPLFVIVAALSASAFAAVAVLRSRRKGL
jgi:hypothetical protein